MRPRVLLLLVVAVLVLPAMLVAYQLRMTSYPSSAFQSDSLSYTIVTPQTVANATLANYVSYTTQTYSGTTVTYYGTFRIGEGNPICATSYPPCKAPSIQLFFLTTESGAKYRLIFLAAPEFVDGAKVVVTGFLVTPSSWNTGAWLPSYYFDGDILVQSMYPT